MRRARRGGRAVECGGLENRYPSLGGSRVQIPPPPLLSRIPLTVRGSASPSDVSRSPPKSALDRLGVVFTGAQLARIRLIPQQCGGVVDSKSKLPRRRSRSPSLRWLRSQASGRREGRRPHPAASRRCALPGGWVVARELEDDEVRSRFHEEVEAESPGAAIAKIREKRGAGALAIAGVLTGDEIVVVA
jgi:hypothetical protein